MPTNTARKIDQAPQSETRIRTAGPVTPLTLYLNAIGAITLMNRDEEVAAGKRIESAQVAILSAIATDHAGLAEVQRIGRRLHRQRVTVGKLVSVPRDGSFDEATEEIRILGLMSEMTTRPVEALREMRLTEAVISKVLRAIRTTMSAESVDTIATAQREIDAARSALVNANLKLVFHLAKKRAQRGGGLDLHDLIQEGSLGLIRASKTFDYSRELRFATYATFWIKQMMDRAVEQKGRTIRLPTYILMNQAKIRNVSRVIKNRTGEEPTQEKIAAEVALSVNQVRSAQHAVREPRSLDVPVGDDGPPLVDFVAKDIGDRGDESVARSVRDELIRVLLSKVTPRERMVLEYRFGIGQREPMNLAEVGRLIGVSRERIRQVEMQALSRCRNAEIAETLKQLAEGT